MNLLSHNPTGAEVSHLPSVRLVSSRDAAPISFSSRGARLLLSGGDESHRFPLVAEVVDEVPDGVRHVVNLDRTFPIPDVPCVVCGRNDLAQKMLGETGADGIVFMCRSTLYVLTDDEHNATFRMIYRQIEAGVR